MTLSLDIAGSSRIDNLKKASLWINRSVRDRVATCDFTLEDTSLALSLTERQEIHLYDSGYSQTFFHGTLAGFEVEQDDPSNASAIRFHCHCQDDNYELERRVVTAACYASASTSDLQRIDNLFSRYYASGIDYSTYVTSTSMFPLMEEQTFENITLRAALAQVCQQSGGMFYTHYDYTTGSLYFHYFDPATGEEDDSSFGLSDDPNNISGSTVGYQHIREQRDAYQLTNKFYIMGTDVSGSVSDATSIAAYGQAEASYDDRDILTACALDAAGSALLSKYKDPTITYFVTTRTGSSLRPGMRLPLEWTTRSVSGNQEVRNIRTTWGSDDEPVYELELGSIPVEFGTTGRVITDRYDDLVSDVRVIADDVFDTTAPALPTFSGGDLSTGVTEDVDGHQSVYVQALWASVSDADLDHYDAQLSSASAFDDFVQGRMHPASGSRIERWEGLVGNVTYYVRVRSVDWVNNYSAWASASILAASDSAEPDQIVGLSVAGARTVIGATWTSASEADLAYYEVQRANNNAGSPDSFATVNNARLSYYFDSDFSEAEIQAACTFWYRARAVDTSGNTGSYSANGSALLNPLGSDSIAACAVIAGKVAANGIVAGNIAASGVVAGNIAASAVVANSISVAALSSISACMGTLTAGEIRIGTGTPGVDYTGLRLFSTYFAGYNNDAVQFYVGSASGKAYWAGGDGELTADGMTLNVPSTASYDSKKAVTWTDGTGDFRVWGYRTSAPLTGGIVEIDAPSGDDASIQLRLFVNSVLQGSITIDSSTGTELSDSPILLSGGYTKVSDVLFVNETANSNMTTGITINQSVDDDEIMAFKSSDVAHGITARTETDTFGTILKIEGDYGGLKIDGYKESGGVTNALVFRGWLPENADTTKSTAARGIIELQGYEASGSDVTNIVADGNVLTVMTYRDGAVVSVCIADEDGDWYTDGSNTATYDEYDDALMCQDLARLMAGEYGRLIVHNRGAFEAAGIIGPTDEQGHFLMSTKRIRMLLLGAVGQLYQRLQRAEGKLALLEGG